MKNNNMVKFDNMTYMVDNAKYVIQRKFGKSMIKNLIKNQIAKIIKI